MAELPIIKWRLWYSDGSCVDSTQSTWANAPDQDVQILEWIQSPAPYRTLTYGVDEYTFEGETAIKYGAWMDEAQFMLLVSQVI